MRELDNETLRKFFAGEPKSNRRGRKDPRPKGSGSIRRREDGRYEIRVTFRDSKNQRHRKSLYRDDKAEAFLELGKLLSRYGLHAKGDNVTVGELADTWLESLEDAVKTGQKKKRATLDLYKGTWKRHIEPSLASKRLDSLTSDDVVAWLATLRRSEVGARTRQLALWVLSRLLNIAVRRGIVARNVCQALDGDDKPTAEKKKVYVLNATEIRKLLKSVAGSRYEALFYLALLGGLREGELFALIYKDVDLSKGTVHVSATLTKDGRGRFIRTEPKTKKSSRVLDLPSIAVESLKRHVELMKAEKQKTGRNDWLFPAPEGGPTVRHNFIRRVFKPALRTAKLPKTTFHSLRHAANSLLLAKGVPLEVIKERGGWTTSRMPLDVYAHVLPTMQKVAAKTLDSMFSTLKKNKDEGSMRGQKE